MAGEIAFTLDGQTVTADTGETIWQVANRLGTEIPRLCLSSEPDFHPDGNCRLCVVEIVGRRALSSSCNTKPQAGMQVLTSSPRALNARRTVMELLLAEAEFGATSEAAALARRIGVDHTRYPLSARPGKVDRSHPGIDVARDACIHCQRCIQACGELTIQEVIGLSGRGTTARITFDLDDLMGDSTCVSCGACAQTCPTGALTFRRPAP
ncbi:MAG: 2Fe-2S iron-sulfur cluster-binding protein [Rhodospirillaceae bacterium]